MITLNELSNGALEALHVVARGPSSRSYRTLADEANGIRCVQGCAAAELLAHRLIQRIDGWGKAVEITDEGRALLASWRQAT